MTNNEEFINLADAMAEALATASTEVKTADDLLALPSPAKPGMTLAEHKSELFNRIREKFEVGRFAKLAGACGGYSHNSGTVAGVLIEVEGGTEEAARDVAMHIAAMRPVALAKEDLDAQEVEKEREILRAAALKEGKPENIVDKMVEGRLRQYFAEKALLEQPFVKEEKVTVGKYAANNAMKIKNFQLYILGQA